MQLPKLSTRCFLDPCRGSTTGKRPFAFIGHTLTAGAFSPQANVAVCILILHADAISRIPAHVKKVEKELRYSMVDKFRRREALFPIFAMTFSRRLVYSLKDKHAPVRATTKRASSPTHTGPLMNNIMPSTF